MKIKKVLLGATLTALTALTLASCGSNTRNTNTPTGNLDMSSVYATALDGELSMSTEMYYNRLRFNSTTLVTNKIKEALYYEEYQTYKAVFENADYTKLTSAQQAMLVPTKDGVALFELGGHDLSDDSTVTNYDYIRNELRKTVMSSVSTSIYGTSDYETLDDYESDEILTKQKTFITARARIGQTFTISDLAYEESSDNLHTVVIKNIDSDVFEKMVDDVLLTQASYLSAQNALYDIADEEYIHNYDDDEDDDLTKNSNYIYDEDGDYLETAYDSTYKTYGTYHAIIIQFDSLKIANRYYNTYATQLESATSIDDAIAAYVSLYNDYYQYKAVDATTAKTNDVFTYTVSKDENEFSDLSDSIKTLVTSTLEENVDNEADWDITKQYLTEPRNIDNKYVMAIRFDTTFDISGTNEETDWDDLEESNPDLYATYTTRIKYDTLMSSRNSYVNTDFNEMIYTRSNNDDTSDDIYIYDPFFEYKFQNTYSEYELINKKYFDNSAIFSIKVSDDYTYTYSVEDFFSDATLANGSSTIYSYFSLEYAYTKYDEYVTLNYIDEDAHDDNEDTLSDAIDNFKSGDNSSYSKKLGVSNFLLLAYGYSTKEDVLKYYYDAAAAQTTYLAQSVFSEWAVDEDGDGTYTYDSSLETSGALYSMLTLGNEKYADLFNINIDHILINIDDDGDGSPDDPDDFLKNNDTVTEAEYEEAVEALAKAIYTEAEYIRANYASTKTTYEILTYIKDQYDLGETLFSDSTKSWDDYKTFNFLLTVEQLASSSNIDQDSVSSFVEPFKDYVIGMYETCVANNVDDEFEYGTFYVYNKAEDGTKTGKVVSSVDDITASNLCKTSFGYHLIVLNSYSEPEATDFTESDDPSGVQANIDVLVYEDSEDDDNNIYITMDSYNTATDEISFNQFFIYYCQTKMSQSSSLDSSISTLISSMYSDIISTYTSANFQNYLLITYLNIQINDTTVDSSIITAEKNYYAQLVIGYDDESDYASWVDEANFSTWKRPDMK